MTTAAVQQERLDDSQSTTEFGYEQDNASDHESNQADSNLRASRHSKSQHAALRPTTIHFYPGAWKIVLERAKDRFVRHVFLNQAFPVRSKDLGVAQAILHEEIARGETEELILDNGKSFYRLLTVVLIKYMTLLAYQQTREMNIVVMLFFYWYINYLAEL